MRKLLLVFLGLILFMFIMSGLARTDSCSMTLGYGLGDINQFLIDTCSTVWAYEAEHLPH